MTLKVKYSDFKQVTRSRSFEEAVNAAELLGQISCDLLGKTQAGERAIRLIGVSVSNLVAIE